MDYLIVAYDHKDVLSKRMEARDAHLQGAKKLIEEGKIINAGAIMEQDKMVGSSMFVSFESEKEFSQWLENEPYVLKGVWDMERFQKIPLKLVSL